MYFIVFRTSGRSNNLLSTEIVLMQVSVNLWFTHICSNNFLTFQNDILIPGWGWGLGELSIGFGVNSLMVETVLDEIFGEESIPSIPACLKQPNSTSLVVKDPSTSSFTFSISYSVLATFFNPDRISERELKLRFGHYPTSWERSMPLDLLRNL